MNASPTQTLQRTLPSALLMMATNVTRQVAQFGGLSDRHFRRRTKAARFLCAIVAAPFCPPLLAGDAIRSASISGQLGVTLIKEPKNASTPKYCVIKLGTNGKVNVWIVEDGKRLFVDKNANRDLTDDGPPIEPSNVRNVDARNWDYNYLLGAITPADGSRHTAFDLRRWNYNEKEDSYGLSLSVDGQLPMYAGWFGTFWSAKRETAPVLHFGRTFTPGLLQTKEFAIASRQQRLSLGFMNPGSGPGAAAGKAKVSVELVTDATQIMLTTTDFEVPVVAPTPESHSKR